METPQASIYVCVCVCLGVAGGFVCLFVSLFCPCECMYRKGGREVAQKRKGGEVTQT